MSAYMSDRPPAREAGPELSVLAKWEEFTGWLLEHTARWPKSARFGLVRRVDDHALDVTELLIVARYEPQERRRVLREVNLRLERLRFLLRIAAARGTMPKGGFETAMRHVDEAGRMVHGWREALGAHDGRSRSSRRGGAQLDLPTSDATSTETAQPTAHASATAAEAAVLAEEDRQSGAALQASEALSS